MPKRILILGGYGQAGSRIAALLLKETDVHVVLGGRNPEKARTTIEGLNRGLRKDRVSAVRVDAADQRSLAAAFQDLDMVVVASSTMEHVQAVAEAAIEVGIDYLDVQLSSPAKLGVLHALKSRVVEKELCFVTDGGFHPGVPAAMIRRATERFDSLETAVVYAVFQLNWKELDISGATIQEFTQELSDFNPTIWKNGRWESVGMKGYRKFDFGETFGVRFCTPMFLEELRSLPEKISTLRETGFYIAGFHWVVDTIIMPGAMIAVRLSSRRAGNAAARILAWGLRTFTGPPFGTVLHLVAEGERKGRSDSLFIRLSHEDAYFLTAAPAVACLLQMLEGRVSRPGLWLQAHYVEAARFFQDLERLGVRVETGGNGDPQRPDHVKRRGA